MDQRLWNSEQGRKWPIELLDVILNEQHVIYEPYVTKLKYLMDQCRIEAWSSDGTGPSVC